MHHFNHILYIVILIAAPFATFIIWSIVGRPRIVKAKQWKQPRAFDTFAKADLELFLDEHEQKIS